MRNGTPQRPPLLVFADDWGRHPSSCQHLIRRLRADYPILWVNTIGTRQVKADPFTFRRVVEKLKNWGKGLTRVDAQMWTIDLPMVPGMSNMALRALNRQLVTARLRSVLTQLGLSAPIVLTTLPYITWLIRGLPRRALVYYCTDDYSYWPSADRPTLQQADRDISREADLILAVSRALVEQHAWTGRCQYFPHGVDFEHFASVPLQEMVAPEVAELPRPRIGFFGLIYEKLDFPLLGAVARAFASGSLVLIGPHAYSPPDFGKLGNVHLLGQKPYEDLPRYLSGLDVLLLPYVNDDMIRRSSPLKLRECLASGKPTVSIDVPEVRVLEPHVRVGADQDSFVQAVRAALAESPTGPQGSARRQVVAADGWDQRAQFLRQCLEQLLPNQANGVARNGFVSGNGTAGRPARVLHLRTVCGPGGGPEKTLLNSPRFLQGDYQLRLAYIRPEEDPKYDLPERARCLGVDLLDIPERHGFDARTLRRLAREVQHFQPDILHASDYKTNVLAVLLGRWFGTRVVTTLHGYGFGEGRLAAYYNSLPAAIRSRRHGSKWAGTAAGWSSAPSAG
jgi:glycosyltransferase involved in cell wall biosynthesis